MAKKCMIAKQKKTPKYKTRFYHRCELCGRPRGFFRDFHICRLCLRRLALEGKIPGMKKSSW